MLHAHTDRQRHSVAAIELTAPGTAQCGRLWPSQIIARGDRHQPLYHPDAGQQSLEPHQDRAERQHRLGGEILTKSVANNPLNRSIIPSTHRSHRPRNRCRCWACRASAAAAWCRPALVDRRPRHVASVAERRAAAAAAWTVRATRTASCRHHCRCRRIGRRSSNRWRRRRSTCRVRSYDIIWCGAGDSGPRWARTSGSSPAVRRMSAVAVVVA